MLFQKHLFSIMVITVFFLLKIVALLGLLQSIFKSTIYLFYSKYGLILFLFVHFLSNHFHTPWFENPANIE